MSNSSVGFLPQCVVLVSLTGERIEYHNAHIVEALLVLGAAQYS